MSFKFSAFTLLMSSLFVYSAGSAYAMIQDEEEDASIPLSRPVETQTVETQTETDGIKPGVSPAFQRILDAQAKLNQNFKKYDETIAQTMQQPHPAKPLTPQKEAQARKQAQNLGNLLDARNREMMQEAFSTTLNPRSSSSNFVDDMLKTYGQAEKDKALLNGRAQQQPNPSAPNQQKMSKSTETQFKLLKRTFPSLTDEQVKERMRAQGFRDAF